MDARPQDRVQTDDTATLVRAELLVQSDIGPNLPVTTAEVSVIEAYLGDILDAILIEASFRD